VELRVLVTTGWLAPLVTVTSVHAAAPETRATDEPPPPELVELGVGAFARYDLGDFCETDGDVVSCTSGRAFVGFEAAPPP
jgi:hypothetical protein